MPLTGNFTFVLIPGNIQEPIREIQANKSGGLEQDALLQYANEYFAKQQQSASVNITAVTVPTNDNNYTACSIYSIAPDNAPDQPPPILNQRATDLLTACGHTVVTHDPNNSSNGIGNAIYGDAFCGRAFDDERTDWERLDMTATEIDPSSDWCRTARKIGGGGGTGRASTPSLSNLAQQIMSNPNSSGSTNSNNGTSPMEILQDTTSTQPLNNYGMDGVEPVLESWGTWIQSNDDIEIRMLVPITTTSKQCQIQFHKNSLKVVVNQETILEGTTYDPIAIDECTYTLQDIKNKRNQEHGPSSSSEELRELCITIGKVETGRTWMYIVK
jgi:CS domain